VLRQLSIELKCNLRESDLAGRYGGDEFCVILPNMPLSQAMDVMERLRKVLQDYRHREVPELRVSLSIGLAAYQPSFTDATTWLEDADKALYIAKNTGRNKVSVNPGSIDLETSTA
jgi:diguanylate cyclase